MDKKKIGLLLGPLSFVVLYFFVPFSELSEEAVAVLACTVWIAIWWITEAISISATALLPIVIFPLSGAMSLGETTASYGHKYVFLFLGGFILAIAIEKWKLHKRVALGIIHFMGTKASRIILGFMVATAFLSMWISNTATTVMILPVGIAIIDQLTNKCKDSSATFGKALMLAIAFSASIGGMATLIGTPPNLVLAGVVEKNFATEISFAQWFMFGFPISLLLLTISWLYLTKISFKVDQLQFNQQSNEIKRQLDELGKLSHEEKLVSLVFMLTAVAWITRSFLLQQWIPHLDDTIIAVTAGLSLFLIPSANKKKALLVWKDAVKLPWGVLILFGGGMALAYGFESSGLAVWIGSQLTSIEGISVFMLILIIVASINFLTEITSNLATTAMLLPILIPLATSLGIHPYMLLVSATLAASCAFMLPVATPPNAIVFASGQISIQDMVKKGIWMNLISIVIISLLVYYVLPWLWGI